MNIQKLAAQILAILCPLLVLIGGFNTILDFSDLRIAKKDKREMRNAGQVMNGRRLKQDVVTTMEASLDKRPIKVLVLGNSTANTNILPKVLAKELGIPSKDVLVLSVPNSVTSHWYAILKNRVYANGHKPPLIVVVSPLVAMVLNQPFSEASHLNLLVQLEEEEPLLDTVIERNSAAWSTMLQNRGLIRTELLDSVRDFSVGLVYPSDNLRRETEAAMDRVFSDANVDHSKLVRAVPVADTRYTRGGAVNASPKAADSIIPELGRLAAANGSKIIMLRPPMAPRTPPSELVDATLDPGTEYAVADLLAADGHLLVDMHQFPMQDSQFTNFGHMNDDGAKLFTKAFADAVLLAQKPPKKPTWDLFGQVVLERGYFYMDSVDAQFSDGPPPIPDPTRKFQVDSEARLGVFSVPDLEFLQADQFRKGVRYGARCSPVRVEEDGAILERSNENCKTVKKHARGRTCLVDGELRFGSSAGDAVRQHDYRLVLDPDRYCMGGYWLYPGDRFAAKVPRDIVKRFKGGITSLEITTLNPNENVPADLTFRVLVGGSRYASGEATVESGKPHTTVIRFDPPIQAETNDLELRVVNGDGGFAMITSGILQSGGTSAAGTKPAGRSGRRGRNKAKTASETEPNP